MGLCVGVAELAGSCKVSKLCVLEVCVSHRWRGGHGLQVPSEWEAGWVYQAAVKQSGLHKLCVQHLSAGSHSLGRMGRVL